MCCSVEGHTVGIPRDERDVSALCLNAPFVFLFEERAKLRDVVALEHAEGALDCRIVSLVCINVNYCTVYGQAESEFYAQEMAARRTA